LNAGHATLIRIPIQQKLWFTGLCLARTYPSRYLKVVGVTGTNGKTTIATLLYRLFHALGYKAGLISTIRYYVGTDEFPATHTTPDALHIRNNGKNGCERMRKLFHGSQLSCD
jgi:UDP-N-acetylmuramyl tripeptide synthase